MRLLTEGGTPLAAMHKYAPISDLVTLVNDNISPSTDCTKKWHRHHWKDASKNTASVSRYMATYDSARHYPSNMCDGSC
jgi:hypothetical protein